MKAERFSPTHQLKTELSGGRSVIVQSDGERFGLIFFNGEDETRLLLSAEAMSAVAVNHARIANGAGEPIAYRWRVCTEHFVQREEEAK